MAAKKSPARSNVAEAVSDAKPVAFIAYYKEKVTFPIDQAWLHAIVKAEQLKTITSMMSLGTLLPRDDHESLREMATQHAHDLVEIVAMLQDECDPALKVRGGA